MKPCLNWRRCSLVATAAPFNTAMSTWTGSLVWRHAPHGQCPSGPISNKWYGLERPADHRGWCGHVTLVRSGSRHVGRKGLRIYCQSDTVGLAETYLSTNLADAPNLFDLSLNWCHATVGSVEEVKRKACRQGVARQASGEDLPLLGILVGDIGDWVLIRGQTPAAAKFDGVTPAFCRRADEHARFLLDDAFCEINIIDDLKTLWGFEIKGGNNPRNIDKHRLIARGPLHHFPASPDGSAYTPSIPPAAITALVI